MPNTAEPRIPGPGELQIVLLIDQSTFMAWVPVDEMDALMDSFEQRLDLAAARTEKIAQLKLRQSIAHRLRQNGAEIAWTDALGTGCLWLSLRHYGNSEALRRGIDSLAPTGVVLTISIGNSKNAAPDTAWAFMVGIRIHDGRPMLAQQSPGQVRLFENPIRS